MSGHLRGTSHDFTLQKNAIEGLAFDKGLPLVTWLPLHHQGVDGEPGAQSIVAVVAVIAGKVTNAEIHSECTLVCT